MRVRALRAAHREAASRAPGRLGRLSCEVRITADPRGVRIDVDVQAPLIERRAVSRPARVTDFPHMPSTTNGGAGFGGRKRRRRKGGTVIHVVFGSNGGRVTEPSGVASAAPSTPRRRPTGASR